MIMSKEKAVAVKTETSIMKESDLAALAGFSQGAMQVRKELIVPPRLSLTQSLSKGFLDGKAKLGDFFCDLKAANYGQSPILIPILIRERASFFDKKIEKVVCSSENLVTNKVNGGKCSECHLDSFYGDWDEAKKKGLKNPNCLLSFEAFFLAKTDNGIDLMPMLFSFRKTSYPSGRELIRKIMCHPHQIPFLFGYKFTVAEGEKSSRYIKSMEKVVLTKEEIDAIAPVARSLIELSKQNKVSIDVGIDDLDDNFIVDQIEKDGLPPIDVSFPSV